MGCGSVSKMNDDQAATMATVQKKYGLSRKTATNIANRFLDADEDGSETLDYKEFLKLLDVEDSRLAKNLFNTIDKKENLEDQPGGFNGKDGAISFKEFAEEMAKIDSMDNEARWKWTFSVYDKNKNGYLDLDEIMQAMNDPNVGIKFSASRLKTIFHERACRNQSKITMPEFVLQCKKHEILEMPVKLIYTKVKAYVFDFDDNDDEFEDKAAKKQYKDYSAKRDETFLKDAEQQEKAKKSGRSTDKKKGGKAVKVKKNADGTTYEDSD